MRWGLALNLALLLAGGVVQADPGFWSLDSIDIPSGVRAAGDSVYQMIMLESAPRGGMGKAELETALAKVEERHEEDAKKPPTEASSANIGFLYQLRSCLDSAAARCDVHEALAVGTAFECGLYSNGVQLCSSFQNVAAAVQRWSAADASAEQDQTRSAQHVEIPIQLLLIDRHRRIVFDTRMESMSAAIIGYASRIDLALIQLNTTIGRPLPFHAPVDDSDADLQDHYIAGFPIVQRPETKQEDYYANPLNRYELSVTIGEIFQGPRHHRADKSPAFVECDADSAPGMSGAPVLDEHGRVIGMLSRSTSNQVGSILVPAATMKRVFGE
jgi:hypothetical protein